MLTFLKILCRKHVIFVYKLPVICNIHKYTELISLLLSKYEICCLNQNYEGWS